MKPSSLECFKVKPWEVTLGHVLGSVEPPKAIREPHICWWGGQWDRICTAEEERVLLFSHLAGAAGPSAGKARLLSSCNLLQIHPGSCLSTHTSLSKKPTTPHSCGMSLAWQNKWQNLRKNWESGANVKPQVENLAGAMAGPSPVREGPSFT